MLIAYCETCGFRIPESDLASGVASKLDENRYSCAKCSAAAGAKKPPTKMITKQMVESARAMQPTAEAPAAASHARITPGTRAPAAHGTHGASATGTRSAATGAKSAQSQNSVMILVGGAAGVLGLVLIFVFMGGKKTPPETPKEKVETVAQNEPKPSPPMTTPAVTNPNTQPAVKLGTPSTPTPAITTPSNTTPATVTLSPASTQEERIRNADKELENMRLERAAKLLEEHKAWFAKNPEDPWGYKEKLSSLVASYRSAPAGIEAAKLLAEVKIPEGERSPDSMTWHRDWEINRGLASDMASDFDGRRFVLATHPLEPGKPLIMNRKVKVPSDKAVLEFNVRAHDAGDCKIIAVVNGKALIDETIGGRTWRTFGLDLTPLKGQEADVSLQHHNTGWNNEHAWWQAPRFVEKASAGAKVAAFDGPAAVATPAVATTQAGAVFTQGKGWKSVFDGKSLDGFAPNTLDGWKLEDGALVNTASLKNSTKPRTQFEDGEIRVRFETVGGSYMHFTARQSAEGGYGIALDRNTLVGMSGKKQELIVTLRGDDVFATLNGQPVSVQAVGKPRRGQLQFGINEGVLKVFSIEQRELSAWRPLLDTGNLDGLLGRGNNLWKSENGVIVNTAPGSLQSQQEFEDGELRVRFEVKDAQYFQVVARQSDTPGYILGFDKGNMAQVDGKVNEIIFTMRGDAVSATVNGRPMDFKVEGNSRPRKGRLQCYASSGTFKILSVDLGELPAPAAATVASTVPSVNLCPDPGFESGAWGTWFAWGAAGIHKGAEHAHSGTCCAAINTEKNGFGQTVKGLTPGVTYELSGWGKLANAGEFFHLGVKDYGGAEKAEAFNTTSYQRVSLKFTVGPANTTAVVFAFKPNGPGMAYIDDIVLAPEGASAPATVAGSGDSGKNTNAPATSTAVGGDLKLQYEQMLADVSVLQFKNGVPQSITRLESARGDAKFAPLAAAIELDVKVAKLLEDVNKGAAKGAALLVDKRAFTLHKIDGKDLNVGKGTNNAVVEVKDDTIVVEQDLGGGKAMSKWPLEQLTAQSRYDLARIGLAAGPETDLRLAAAGIILLQNGADISQRFIRQQLEAAKKGGASPELAAHLWSRLEARDLETAAEAAYKKLEALIKDKKWADAKAFVAAYRKDYSGTLALAKVAAALEQKSSDVEYALNPLKPMLWTSFWSGEEANKFKTMHFARADSKINWEFGNGTPDPRVPADNFGIKWGGKLRIDKPGVYRFRGNADDHLDLNIDGQMILDSNNNNVEKDVTLTKGDHDFKISYFESSGPAHLFFHWKMEGAFDWQEIPADRLWHDPRAVEKYQKE
jgi:hypothetical protein